ncbi:hypothetical protein UAY_01963 [Enterococcus moraviensis ATCC BAA-383]|uniref:HTH cro/C1-type domain-containing protein n=1 Tax=Enterococcus moraviensis ATCC BAA-383 TaxID=1158609 RepID=R2T2B9_9ENTE|nr:helix-turn-helix transcriptional regulator [Enterococcus moraviensis]EOH99186.1 hypothetical protein UAY_01963 [Enterococcus moraviensis ATCC BAA-383]EOT72131.1 hypothetical protein I586_01939 [Enterococcus moraviensis ATCC BAA-383]OJG67436.1 hypothetical protein RV09_GL002652 [Enterococcus moraviensis]
MYVLTEGETLKKLRKLRGLNQKDCCQGIISRHTYSRIERNQTSIQYHILLELLERLNFSYQDFWFYKNEKNALYASKKKLSCMDNTLDLYAYFKENKKKSIEKFHCYLLCKLRMEQFDFDTVEKINDRDLQHLNKYLKKLTFFSIIDLTLVSEMCDYLAYDTVKRVSLTILKQINLSSDSSEFTRSHQYAIHLALCTNTSIALKNEDYSFTKKMLTKTKDFLEQYPNHYFLLFLHFNTHTLNYKLTMNNHYLSKLFLLKDYMKELEDYQTAEKIETQIKSLIQHTASLPEITIN